MNPELLTRFADSLCELDSVGDGCARARIAVVRAAGTALVAIQLGGSMDITKEIDRLQHEVPILESRLHAHPDSIGIALELAHSYEYWAYVDQHIHHLGPAGELLEKALSVRKARTGQYDTDLNDLAKTQGDYCKVLIAEDRLDTAFRCLTDLEGQVTLLSGTGSEAEERRVDLVELLGGLIDGITFAHDANGEKFKTRQILVLRMDSLVEGLPVSCPRRKDLLKQVASEFGRMEDLAGEVERLEEIANEFGNDENTDESLSMALAEWTKVALESGDLPLAGKKVHELEPVVSRLSTNYVWLPERILDLVNHLGAVGKMHLDSGDLPASEDCFRRQRALIPRVKVEDQEDHFEKLAKSMNDLGCAYLAKNEDRKAISILSDALHLVDTLIPIVSDGVFQRVNRDILRETLGDALLETADTASSLEYYELELSSSRKLLREVPKDDNPRRSIASVSEKVGAILLSRGNRTRALAQFREGVTQAKWLVRAHPRNGDDLDLLRSLQTKIQLARKSKS